MKKILVFVSIALTFLISGCATGPEVTPAQNDAQMRTIGRGIGAALVIASPESIPGAREYCARFAVVEDVTEARDLIRLALGYFMEDENVANSSALVDAVYDALVAIGFDDSAIQEVLEAGAGSIENVEIPEMDAETIRNVKLILDGFCAMTGLTV